MPVVVSYMPRVNRPDPYAQREQNDADSLYLRGQEINQQGAAQRDRNRLATREQDAQNQYRQQALDQSSDQFQQEQGLRTREQDLRENQFADQEAATAPNTIVDAQGRQFTGNRQQASQVEALNQVSGSEDDYDQGIRKIFGVPEATVPYQAPDGQTINLSAKDAATRISADKAAQAKQDQAAAVLTQRASAHTDLVNHQNDMLDLTRERYLATTDKDRAAIDAKIVAGQKYLQAGTEKVAAAEVSAKRHAIDEYIRAKGYVPVNDPTLLQLQDALKASMDEEKAIVEKGRAKAATPPANAPGRKTTSETPTQDAPTPQSGGKSGQPAQYTATATGPDGRKIGYNPITKAWEPIQP